MNLTGPAYVVMITWSPRSHFMLGEYWPRPAPQSSGTAIDRVG